MKQLAVGFLLTAAVLSGCVGFFNQPPEMNGVTVLDAEKFSLHQGSSRVCSAKIKNTNPYNVTVTYQFDGGDTRSDTIPPSTEIKNGWTLINEPSCMSAEVELLSVKRVT